MTAVRTFGIFSEHVRGEPRFHEVKENVGSRQKPDWVRVPEIDGEYGSNGRKKLERWARRHGELEDWEGAE